MTKPTSNDEAVNLSMKSNARAELRPIYLLVVFWGEIHRDHFAKLLLPSLLAPGNLPAISSIQGSKLVICTTTMDWEVVQRLPLFQEVRKYVEPVLIEIGIPKPGTSKYQHSGAGFKRAVQKCWKDGAYGTFLVPDLILSNGTLKYLRDLAAAGAVATLVPSLRYDLEACLSTLRARSLYKEGRAVAISARELAGVGLENLHSENKRYEWDSRYFCRQPFSVWWRFQNHRNILLHTTGWQMALVNFHALPTLNDGSLDYTTQDDVFIDQNFYRFRNDGTLHLITDSDDAFYLSLTSENDLTYYPLKMPLLNRIPGVGSLAKFLGLKLFMSTNMFDPFRRWAVTVPIFIHDEPLPQTSIAYADTTIRLLRRAVQPPKGLLLIYGKMPTRALLRSYVALALQDPRKFLSKLWARIFGQKASGHAAR